MIAVGGRALGAIGLCCAAFAFSVAFVAAADSLTMIVVILGLLGAAAVAFWHPDIRLTLLAGFMLLLSVDLMKGIFVAARIYGLSITISDIPFVLLFAIWVVDRLQHPERPTYWTSTHRWGVVLLAWLALVTTYSPEPMAGFVLLLYNLKWLLYIFVLSDLIKTPRDLRVALTAFCAALFVQSAMVGLQTVTGLQLALPGAQATSLGRQILVGTESVRRPAGFMQHPNAFAAYLTMALPPLLAVVLVGPGRIRRSVWVVSTILLAAGTAALIVALSRAGWISFAVAAVFLVIVGWRIGMLSGKHVCAAAVAGMLALAAVSVAYPRAWDRIVSSDHRSSESRRAMNAQALAIISLNPVAGIGLGGYHNMAQRVWPPEFGRVSESFREELLKGVVHNKYLLMIAETGVIGTGLYLVLLLSAMARGLRRHPAEPDLERAIRTGLVASIVGQMTFYLFDHFSYDIRIGLMYVIVALTCVMAKLNAQARPVVRVARPSIFRRSSAHRARAHD